MNPAELRMMWMSQYNPERIALEDAASYFSHPSVGLSVMDDISHQTSTMDMNPMMSIVGGDFSGQAAAAAAAVASSAAAAAALGVQPTTFITTANPNDIYGLTQVSGIHHVLQQSAAFQNYPNMIDDEDVEHDADGTQYVSQVYDQLDDSSCYDGGISGLTSKQEIINIDDFVMMTDSNSYDGTELISGDNVADSGNDDKLLIPSISKSTSSSHRAQRKTRKIEPVNRPGLVLKTPIAYKGNIDPSVIPIQKDGMAVCERCGAIGVKHTFYTKSRRFCSMSCARGELFSLVCNKMIDSGRGGGGSGESQQSPASVTASSISGSSNSNSMVQSSASLTKVGGASGNGSSNYSPNDNVTGNGHSNDIELALRVSHIKNANYRFKVTDQSLTQINSNDSMMDNSDLISDGNDIGDMENNSTSFHQTQVKPIEMYRDVLPHDELPQIPKYERLPSPCPQSEKICSVRRRQCDPTHSYDWTPRLNQENFYAAPVTCFPHAPGYDVWDNIGIDMKVEVENTDCESQEIIQPGQTPHSFWVATILNICGYKALMRYEGFDDSSHDFWVNLCSSEVHSVGWCATRGKPLIPPRSIENKFKDWKDFLVERLSGARTLPSSFYNKINDSMNSRFRVGLNLECVDKDRISQVRLATVHKIVGKRLFVKYFDSDDGFWCHEDSPIIHPVGWATTVGHNLAAPKDYLERMLAGREQMIEVHEDDATIELFKMNFTFEEYYLDGKTNSFLEGMKLEAVDPLNLSSICAATVMAVLKFGYMMIRIDSYQPDATLSDWFCYHEKSPSIFPVGFCESHNIQLTPPNGYDTTSFTWKKYLENSASAAAPEELFHRVVPEHGFEVGMSLECADLMDPRLVCVATVARVVGRLLKIHFDGWTDEYDQWLDCESPDFYPVGWCTLVNHKLEGPPVQAQPSLKPAPKPKQKKKRKKVAAAGKSINRTINIKKETHILNHDPNPLKVGGQTRINIKKEMKSEPMYYDDDEEDDDYEDDVSRSDQSTPVSHTPESVDKQRTISSHVNNATTIATNSSAPPIERKATSYIGNSSAMNSKYIPRLSEVIALPETMQSGGGGGGASFEHGELMPETWNVYDVSQFLRVNDCTAHCDMFSRNKIDGKRLLQLSKDEIITLLGMKVGPALKIFDLIQQLKCKMNPSKSRLHKANKSFL